MLFHTLSVFPLDFLCFLFCFSNALPRGEYVDLACAIILLWLDCSIYSSVRYSYLWVFPDKDAIFLLLLFFIFTLIISCHNYFLYSSEAAHQRCSYIKLFWKYAANLQENTHVKVCFQKCFKANFLK